MVLDRPTHLSPSLYSTSAQRLADLTAAVLALASETAPISGPTDDVTRGEAQFS
jgi:hypothetical protein